MLPSPPAPLHSGTIIGLPPVDINGAINGAFNGGFGVNGPSHVVNGGFGVNGPSHVVNGDVTRHHLSSDDDLGGIANVFDQHNGIHDFSSDVIHTGNDVIHSTNDVIHTGNDGHHVINNGGAIVGHIGGSVDGFSDGFNGNFDVGFKDVSFGGGFNGHDAFNEDFQVSNTGFNGGFLDGFNGIINGGGDYLINEPAQTITQVEQVSHLNK